MARDVSGATHDSREIKSHKILDETFKEKPMAWYHSNDYQPTAVEFMKDLKVAFLVAFFVFLGGFLFGRVAHAEPVSEYCADVPIAVDKCFQNRWNAIKSCAKSWTCKEVYFKTKHIKVRNECNFIS